MSHHLRVSASTPSFSIRRVSGPSAQTIRLNNHVVVDMADVRNNVKDWVMKNRLLDCAVDQHWLRLPNKSMNDPFLIAKRIRRRLDIVCLFSFSGTKPRFLVSLTQSTCSTDVSVVVVYKHTTVG